ncbi:MAG: hypothetical protein ACK559_16425, partial [bacterium]
MGNNNDREQQPKLASYFQQQQQRDVFTSTKWRFDAHYVHATLYKKQETKHNHNHEDERKEKQENNNNNNDGDNVKWEEVFKFELNSRSKKHELM